jgi:hypothetical protein
VPYHAPTIDRIERREFESLRRFRERIDKAASAFERYTSNAAVPASAVT